MLNPSPSILQIALPIFAKTIAVKLLTAELQQQKVGKNLRA